MSEVKTAFLGIDITNDFMDQTGAAMPIMGSSLDAHRAADFIERKAQDIDKVLLVRDAHPVMHIAHPGFWRDVQPFTKITHQDLVDEKYMTAREEDFEWAAQYTFNLEKLGRFQLEVWPEHCIAGSWGSAFENRFMDAVIAWDRTRAIVDGVSIYDKGVDPYTERYSIFKPEVEGKVGSAQTGMPLVFTLKTFDRVYVAGQALSHCINWSIRDLLDFAPEMKDRLIILRDTMSAIGGFESQGEQFLSDMAAQGVEIIDADDF